MQNQNEMWPKKTNKKNPYYWYCVGFPEYHHNQKQTLQMYLGVMTKDKSQRVQEQSNEMRPKKKNNEKKSLFCSE